MDPPSNRAGAPRPRPTPDATDPLRNDRPHGHSLPGAHFQVFAKPWGALCNLDCRYCYYLEKESLFPGTGPVRMDETVLEAYILQHVEAAEERNAPCDPCATVAAPRTASSGHRTGRRA